MPDKPTMEELEAELAEKDHVIFHNKKMKEERDISNSMYAVKLVEKIVFGLVALILIAVVGAWIALVVR
jgi:lipopolysaccharide/colanic/teichoic acid biosynthesis glycosyltransferase